MAWLFRYPLGSRDGHDAPTQLLSLVSPLEMLQEDVLKEIQAI